MNDEKHRQVLEDQRNEDMHFVASSIFAGLWSYSGFIDTSPKPQIKRYVDDWLRAQLALPKYKGKIIPGFNDK